MNYLERGLSTGGKAGVVIILVVLVLGVGYLASPMLTGGGSRSTSSSTTAGSSAIDQSGGPLRLFGSFSQMQIVETIYDNGEGHALDEQHTVSYQVLGKASLNSTQYTKVKFTQSESPSGIIAWFNPQGGIDRVDVLGVRNYTGAGASIYAQLYVGVISGTAALSSNTTLFSKLTKTTETTTSIGSTQLNVATYTLAKPIPPYDALTLKLATIPGTSTTFSVYFDVVTSDQLETVFQVLSLTK